MKNNNDQPRKNNQSQSSKTAIAIKNLKAEITPTVHKYTPSVQPGVIKPGIASWNTKKIRIFKNLAAGSSSSVSVTAGDVIGELFGTNTASFYIEQLSVWNLGNGLATASSINLTSDFGLVNANSLNISDFGTVDRPAAVGLNIPRALAAQYVAVTNASTAALFTVKKVVEFASTASVNTIVADLWVVYQN